MFIPFVGKRVRGSVRGVALLQASFVNGLMNLVGRERERGRRRVGNVSNMYPMRGVCGAGGCSMVTRGVRRFAITKYSEQAIRE